MILALERTNQRIIYTFLFAQTLRPQKVVLTISITLNNTVLKYTFKSFLLVCKLYSHQTISFPDKTLQTSV